jgi:cytoskeletal protein RodZ
MRVKERNLELAYSKSFPVEEKTMRANSASQRVESSKAFLNSPLLLLEKVTCLAVVLSIFFIWIFLLVIFAPKNNPTAPLHQTNQILSPKSKLYFLLQKRNNYPSQVFSIKESDQTSISELESKFKLLCMKDIERENLI